MRALNANELVSTWERTHGEIPLRQAIEYLACAETEHSVDQWASLPFGRLCHALFRLRRVMFGSAMAGVIHCPQCGQRLEFTFTCDDVEGLGADPDPILVTAGEHSLFMRLPTAADLLTCRSAGDLLTRCAAEPVEPTMAWIQAASNRFAEADPLIETVLNLVCPACDHRWQALLDIVTYLTREVAHHARTLLGEVHVLASAYGWGEREILALSPMRRRAYLEMAGA